MENGFRKKYEPLTIANVVVHMIMRVTGVVADDKTLELWMIEGIFLMPRQVLSENEQSLEMRRKCIG